MTSERLPRLGFIGAGVTGHAFACCLHRAGYPVVAVASRTFESVQALAARLKRRARREACPAKGGESDKGIEA